MTNSLFWFHFRDEVAFSTRPEVPHPRCETSPHAGDERKRGPGFVLDRLLPLAELSLVFNLPVDEGIDGVEVRDAERAVLIAGDQPFARSIIAKRNRGTLAGIGL